MESLVSGTLAGIGSFRCESCGHVLTLVRNETLPRCPGCGGERYLRASAFAIGPGAAADADERSALLATVAEEVAAPGLYLVYREGTATLAVPFAREWTRIGRSLAADIRFDDATVSRRHALIVRQPDEVRVLDDRSLNGVFVNGERVEWRALRDGDEISVGRYRLHYVAVAGTLTDADIDDEDERTGIVVREAAAG